MFESHGITFEDDIRSAFLAMKGVTIPDIPHEIIELDKEVSARYPNTKKMAEIISGNTKLSAKLLQIANSPVMRPRTPITNIQAAV
jgi:HD-like signal output (HDOD) protein